MLQKSHRRSWCKNIGLIVWILFFLLFYLITINNTSTKGYFLRQSMKQLDDAKFRHNVAMFQIAIVQRQLWDKVNVDFIGERDDKARKQQTNIIQLHIDEK